jgi:hypothetical protein
MHESARQQAGRHGWVRMVVWLVLTCFGVAKGFEHGVYCPDVVLKTGLTSLAQLNQMRDDELGCLSLTTTRFSTTQPSS